MALRHRVASLAAVLIVACGTLSTFSISTSFADTNVVVSVVNADGGVFWRSQPNWETPIQVVQHGVYTGDQVELSCYMWGGTVPPYYDNSLWYQATVVSGLGVGSGLVNDHFIDSGTDVPNQPMPGVPECGSSAPTTSGPQSVFYSPNNTPNAFPRLSVAELNIPLDEWDVGGCSASLAADIPNGVSTLAGWSLGRLGPIYFLASATPQQVAQVHTIILFDPGDTSDFANPPLWKRLLGDQTCDWRYPINGLLANWLSSNKVNQLVVLTGQDSEEKNSNGQSTFAGLWKYYFAGIWDQPFAGQALVCDYNNLSHPQVLKDFAGLVQTPGQGCPTAQGAPQPVAWNP